MTKHLRSGQLPPVPPARGPNGRGLCRWCQTEVPPRRQTWCSDRCVKEYQLTQPNTYRAEVIKRDGSICRRCRFEPMAIAEEMSRLFGEPSAHEQVGKTFIYESQYEQARLWLIGQCGPRIARAFIFKRSYKQYRLPIATAPVTVMYAFWSNNPVLEVDHIIPLHQGGTNALDNLQVLCVRCHVDKTGEDRKRKDQTPLPQPTTHQEAAMPRSATVIKFPAGATDAPSRPSEASGAPETPRKRGRPRTATSGRTATVRAEDSAGPASTADVLEMDAGSRQRVAADKKAKRTAREVRESTGPITTEEAADAIMDIVEESITDEKTGKRKPKSQTGSSATGDAVYSNGKASTVKAPAQATVIVDPAKAGKRTPASDFVAPDPLMKIPDPLKFERSIKGEIEILSPDLQCKMIVSLQLPNGSEMIIRATMEGMKFKTANGDKRELILAVPDGAEWTTWREDGSKQTGRLIMGSPAIEDNDPKRPLLPNVKPEHNSKVPPPETQDAKE